MIMLPESSPSMSDFEDKILTETRKCNALHDTRKPIKADGIYQFNLQEFREACRILGKNILTDELLEQELVYLEERVYKMRERLSSGMKVVVSIFPCDANGMAYSPEDIRRNAYFHILRQPDSGGAWHGYAGLGPSTHGFMLPAEIQSKCSFIINFKDAQPPTQPHGIDDADWQKLKKQFTQAYLALRMILGVTNSA